MYDLNKYDINAVHEDIQEVTFSCYPVGVDDLQVKGRECECADL